MADQTLRTVKGDALTHAEADANFSAPAHETANIIINGNMDIWQRETTIAGIPANTFMADRWEYDKNGLINHTASRDTDVPTVAESGVKSNYSLKLDVITIDASIGNVDYANVRYQVEGYDFKAIAQREFTLSFWVKDTKTGIHCLSVQNGASGVTDRSFVAEYTINTTNTWEKKSVTISPSPSAGSNWNYQNDTGLIINFLILAGSNYQTTAGVWQTGNYFATANIVNAGDNTANNFLITQVKLEVGNTATQFYAPNYADELDKCLRYFWRNDSNDDLDGYLASGYYETNTQGVFYVQFPVTMRGVPTFGRSAVIDFVTLDLGTVENTTNIGAVDATRNGVRIDTTNGSATAGDGTLLKFDGSGSPGDRYIQFDAEL